MGKAIEQAVQVVFLPSFPLALADKSDGLLRLRFAVGRQLLLAWRRCWEKLNPPVFFHN